MQEFRSKTGNSLAMFFIVTLYFPGLLVLLLYSTTSYKFTQITFSTWIVIVLIYGVVAYLYAGITNNDILLFENRLEIVNRIPLFKKHHSFEFNNINAIEFKSDWTETFGKNIKPLFIKYIITQWVAPFVFPPDYKWIAVIAERRYRFYCFGIETDFYENDSEPVFEDLFQKLSKKGIKVQWKSYL